MQVPSRRHSTGERSSVAGFIQRTRDSSSHQQASTSSSRKIRNSGCGELCWGWTDQKSQQPKTVHQILSAIRNWRDSRIRITSSGRRSDLQIKVAWSTETDDNRRTINEPHNHMYTVLRNNTPVINADDIETAIRFVQSLERALDRRVTHSPYTIVKAVAWSATAAYNQILINQHTHDRTTNTRRNQLVNQIRKRSRHTSNRGYREWIDGIERSDMIINMLVNLVYLGCMIVFFLFGVAIAPVLRSDIITTTHDINHTCEHASCQINSSGIQLIE